MVPGSLVLGQVCQITLHDVALALPNNLTGYVPITSISDRWTQRIEKLPVDEGSDESESDEDSLGIDLKDIFSIGQYLRAYVVSTIDTAENKPSEKGKRRIELSLRPQQANAGLTTKDLVPHSMIMASVISVEDHGLIMDIGIDDGTRGFMSSKEIGNHAGLPSIKEGAVFLSMITGLNSNGKIVKLSADVQKIANPKKLAYISEAPTVDAFLPGTAIELLVTNVTSRGIGGKVMGMVNVTADLMHSGAGTSGYLDKRCKIGSKIKGRIICTFPASDPRKLGISLLEHVICLSPQQTQRDGQCHHPLDVMPLSTIVEDLTIRKVEDGIGLFVDVGVKGVPGFVHISRITDGKIDSLSETTGPYKPGSIHRGRIIGYNAVDGIYFVSLEPKIIAQPFLRIEDLRIGEIVKGKVERIVVNANGVGGLLVNLADGITGFVPEMHMADVTLLHPEKKFKEGLNVSARVLSTDAANNKIRLTLKKTLLNSDSVPLKSYSDLTAGMHSLGTIVNIIPAGAVVQFYGLIRGFLPVSEMSEAYIKDPSQHFRIGQVVNVYVLNVDATAGKLTVSCKDPAAFGVGQQSALKKLRVGETVSGTVQEKSNDHIAIELSAANLRAVLPVGHLTDGSNAKNVALLKKIRVGQILHNLMVLDKSEQKHLITLTSKPSLLSAAKSQSLLREFEDIKANKVVQGFVRNVTPSAVFVQFCAGLTGLIPRARLPDEILNLPDFGLQHHQSISTRVVSVDHSTRRFLLSAKDLDRPSELLREVDLSTGPAHTAINPVDDTIRSINDLVPGRLTSAKIISIKETQVNVQLADNIQGRIDASQIFDSWEDIKDRKHPLRIFTNKQIIPVRVLGIHDARNHRFLPISHRTGKTLIFELSAKASDRTDKDHDVLTLDKVKIGTSWIAFVNNVSDDCLWVNISPNIRGRISALDVSDDVSLLQNLVGNFPIGSAIRVRVIGVDVTTNRLDLTARSENSVECLDFQNLSQGIIVPGKVTRVNDTQIMIQLSDSVSGPVNLVDLADDFSDANSTVYSKNEIVRVCVTSVDASNKRISLSMRPSRVLNSSLPVKDREITSISQLKVNDVVRGFVRNVADNGVFINLGGNVTAYVRVSDLSDSYLKDWKSNFQVGQLVKGKVILADALTNHVQLSLKTSILDKNYTPPLIFKDLKVGQVVTGKIRKVEDFGVFIVIDNSANLSGLCHKSEMAETKVNDARELYQEGDAVKAIILKLDSQNRRINFGLRAGYFDGEESGDEQDDDDDRDDGVYLAEDDEKRTDDIVVFEDRQFRSHAVRDSDNGNHPADVISDLSRTPVISAIHAGGFDWTASNLDDVAEQLDDGSEQNDIDQSQKKKRRKAIIKVDRTGELDANGPQSVGDFERLLLGRPDSSQLWIEYMAFQMKLGELAKTREVAERALRTINVREETEKLNIWVALLNLECTYGTDETLEEIFKRACVYNESQEIHEKLISIYIQSGKLSVSGNIQKPLCGRLS